MCLFDFSNLEISNNGIVNGIKYLGDTSTSRCDNINPISNIIKNIIIGFLIFFIFIVMQFSINVIQNIIRYNLYIIVSLLLVSGLIVFS